MNDWPQIAIAIVMMWRFAVACLSYGRNRELTSGAAAFAVLIEIGTAIGYALILHAGGFW